MTDDLISRQAAIDALGEEPKVWDERVDDYAIGQREQWRSDRLSIEALPSAQPERKTGRWLQTRRGERGFSRPGFRCDQCGEVNPRSSYCPSCGARMEEREGWI